MPHPPKISLWVNLQYITSASRRFTTDKAQGKSSLSSNLIRGMSALSDKCKNEEKKNLSGKPHKQF